MLKSMINHLSYRLLLGRLVLNFQVINEENNMDRAEWYINEINNLAESQLEFIQVSILGSKRNYLMQKITYSNL